MIRIFPMPVANYRIDGKDLFTEHQMHSYAIQCQEAVEEQKNKNRTNPCSIYLSKPNAQATSPQREWQGLTEMEKIEIQMLKWWDWEDTFDLDGYTRAIEAKLKEKNT